MKLDDARELVRSGQAGKAFVGVPLRLDIEEGREILRDKTGAPQGAVERTFANVSLDGSQESA